MRTSIRFLLLASILTGRSFLGYCQPAPTTPPEKVAVVFGQNIRYQEAGQGPAVILLHGLGASSEIWANSIAPLSTKYHVYAPDQLGFGHSDKPLLDYKIATWVDFLEAFMQSQKIAKATLVGNSLGGWIALDFALQHPAMVEKLVLVNSAGLAFDRLPAIDLNPSSMESTRALMKALFYNKQMVSDAFVQYVFVSHLRNNDGATIRSTLMGFSAQDQFEDKKLPSVRVPTLVIWGRDDELIPLARGEAFHQGIAGSKMVVIDQCGHLPQVEKPADFNRALMDFLAQ
jgi:pimeloyl-ACP methyl ester carboxylesterase